MALIKLKCDQGYISESGKRRFGKRDSNVLVSDGFLPFIKGKYELVSEAKEVKEIEGIEGIEEVEDNSTESEAPYKPIGKMNKAELISFAVESGVELTEYELGMLTKAQIIERIELI